MGRVKAEVGACAGYLGDCADGREGELSEQRSLGRRKGTGDRGAGWTQGDGDKWTNGDVVDSHGRKSDASSPFLPFGSAICRVGRICGEIGRVATK